MIAALADFAIAFVVIGAPVWFGIVLPLEAYFMAQVRRGER